MTDGTKQVSEQVRLNRELLAAIDSLPALSRQTAIAERDYKIALSKRTLELKQCGYPVTVIMEITRGDEQVAGLRFERDIARESLKISYEKINAIKLQMRILQENIKLDMCSQP